MSRRRAVVPAVLLTLVLAGQVSPAGAHARVVGTSPADGAMVDQPPERVTIVVDAKPATVEGDPIEVYGPAGRRIDVGSASVNPDSTELSIGLSPDAELAAGHYEVVYRIVSADAHLIAGRFSFHSHAARPAAVELLRTQPAARRGLRAVHPTDGPLRLALAVCAGALVAVALPGKGRRGRAQ